MINQYPAAPWQRNQSQKACAESIKDYLKKNLEGRRVGQEEEILHDGKKIFHKETLSIKLVNICTVYHITITIGTQ